MPLPSSINDLSTTASANSPAGSESPGLIDDYLRTYASYIAILRDGAGSFRGCSSTSTSTTLSVADGGKEFVTFGTGGYTVTLPPSSSLSIGWAINIGCIATSLVTLARQGADVIDGVDTAGTVSSIQIGNGESVVITYAGSGKFYAFGANSANLKKAAMFASTLSGQGYQKLPSGLIIQWGGGTPNASGNLQQTLPIAFPSTQLKGYATSQGEANPGTIVNVNTLTTTLIDARIRTAAGAASTVPISWLAIGI